MTEFLSPLASWPGAVVAEQLDSEPSVGAVDHGVALHYGDPLREQRRLAEGEAFVDLSHRGVVSVSGPDRLSWLFTLSSQDVRALKPGDSAQLLLLTLQGRIEFDAKVVDDGDTTWLLCEADSAGALTEWLESMRFMLRVEVTNQSAEFGVVAATVPLELDYLCFVDPWPNVQVGGFSYTGNQEHPGFDRPWFEYLVPLNDLESVATSLQARGLSLAGSLAAEALRIAAWQPRQLLETDERTIPHELDLLRTAVHLSKGCYKGQETVARVHNLGRPPRRLVFLHVDGSANVLPRHGSPVWLDGREVGSVTSSALHYEMGPIALAVIKRNASAESEVEIVLDRERVSASQEIIVSPEAGQVVDRAKGFLRPPR